MNSWKKMYNVLKACVDILERTKFNPSYRQKQAIIKLLGEEICVIYDKELKL